MRSIEQWTLERLFDVCVPEPNTGCWLWPRGRTSEGYGVLSDYRDGHRVRMLAHRLADRLAMGSDAGAFFVCHRCDTPACCNPDHLFRGTGADNSHDMAMKGRAHRVLGANNSHTKLTEAEARAIVNAYACGGVSMAQLGRRYGIRPSSVHKIVSGKTWRCATEAKP